MKKRVLAILLATVIVVGGSVPAIATPSDQELNDTRQKYAEIENKISEIENKIYDLDVKIEPLAVTIEKNKKEMTNINNSIDNTTKDIEQTEKEIDTLDKLLGERVKALYTSGNLEFSYLSFMFEAESTSDFFSRVGNVGKIISKDKEAIQEIIEKKDDLSEKIKSLEEKKIEIDKLTQEVQKSKNELDIKKKEQESLVAQAKAERSKFDAEYLSKIEREVVEGQFAVINNSSSSVSSLEGAISQLRNIRDHQIKSPTVVSEINNNIEKAKRMVSDKKAASIARSASRGTRTSVSVPSAGNAQSILNEAYSHLGKPYVYGATGANTFDCSGFTQYVYKHAAGVDITRTTYSQVNVGASVSQSQLQPGDLIFTHAGHVGIYVGNGNMIHAPQTGDVVKVSPVYKFYAGRRIL